MRRTYFAICAILSMVLMSSCSEKKVMCPMCNGTGTFVMMEGDIFEQRTPCTACNQTGQMPESDAEELASQMRQIDAMLGVNNGGSNAGSSYSRCDSGFDSTCPDCHGSGKCNMCAGRGEYRLDYCDGGYLTDCAICKGRGICIQCRGKGSLQ